jgi:hypothetical protein
VLAQTVRWRLQNWEPAPGEVDAWRTQGPAAQAIAEAGRLRPDDRAQPAGLPGIVAALHASLVSGIPQHISDRADAALLAGELSAAASAYADRMSADPADIEAWVGFAMTGASHPVSSKDLIRRPDIVFRLTESKT